MQRICFVCTGNICRSPMAEFLFRDLAQRAGLGGAFSAASAAVSAEELGNPVYPPARRILGPAAQGRIHLLLEYADRPGQEVADPWYTGDFAAAWADIAAGCAGLLRALSPTR